MKTTKAVIRSLAKYISPMYAEAIESDICSNNRRLEYLKPKYLVLFLQTESSIHLLKGYIYEAAENRTLAQESFRAALEADPFCYEAFRALTKHHMLSIDEGLLNFLFFQQ